MPAQRYRALPLSPSLPPFLASGGVVMAPCRADHGAPCRLDWLDSPQAADVLCERLGQHVDAALHQVGGRGTRRRLEVHRGAGAQEVRHVGDVHADLYVAQRSKQWAFIRMHSLSWTSSIIASMLDAIGGGGGAPLHLVPVPLCLYRNHDDDTDDDECEVGVQPWQGKCRGPSQAAPPPPPPPRGRPLASKLPLSRRRACSASSMSLQPGGSTLQMHRWRMSRRRGSDASSARTDHGSSGTHACTAGVKGCVLMSCSMRITSCKGGAGRERRKTMMMACVDAFNAVSVQPLRSASRHPAPHAPHGTCS